jgi:hypothetical protein
LGSALWEKEYTRLRSEQAVVYIYMGCMGRRALVLLLRPLAQSGRALEWA